MATSAVPASKYTPRSFNRKKYVVENYQYPSDLMGLTSEGGGAPQATYGGNYAIFYINVNNESKMIENPEDPSVELVDVDASERVKKGLAGREYTKTEVGAVNAVMSIGGATVASKIGLPGIGTAAAAANIIGTQATFANTKNSTFSRPQKRLKSVIALHVPNQLSIRYGAGWSDEETFGFQAFMEGGKALVRAFEQGGKKALMDNVKDTAKTLSSPIASKALQSGPGGAAMSALTGLAPNPMKEQVFKGVDFRTFTMEYQFAPRNIEESNNVNNIIRAFKYHMHPEYKDANNFLFLYPSEFDIEYYHGGEENLNIHRHTSCVLTELNVNYTPNGNFTTFIQGRPSQINVTMSFKELTILTKELIQEGL
jgi:hypothetical protein